MAYHSPNGTHTYGNQSFVYTTADPRPNLNATNILKCDKAFGVHNCNGIGGVFGQEYRPPTKESYGLWKVWLWLPDTNRYAIDYWEWEGSSQILANAWIGEYNSTSLKYFQYGFDITLNKA